MEEPNNPARSESRVSLADAEVGRYSWSYGRRRTSEPVWPSGKALGW